MRKVAGWKWIVFSAPVFVFAASLFFRYRSHEKDISITKFRESTSAPKAPINLTHHPVTHSSPLNLVHAETPPVDSEGEAGPQSVTFPDTLSEYQGLYSYHSPRYFVTLDQNSISFSTGSKSDGLGAGKLAFSFQEARLGDILLVAGTAIPPTARPLDRTVSYSRGPIEERYSLRAEALEQVFVISRLPDLRGDLTVSGVISTNLVPPAEGTTSRRLAFSRQGEECITISKAIAFDAAGSSLPLDLAWSGHGLSMTLPSDWIERAQLPITIDPVIGTPITVRSTTAPLYGSDLAYNSTANEWLCAWSEVSGTIKEDIWTQRISSSGALVGNPLHLGLSNLSNTVPVVSYSPTTNRYLVAWAAATTNTSTFLYSVYGSVLNGDGTLFAGPIKIASIGASSVRRISAAFDGTNWYLCWDTNGLQIFGLTSIMGAFVSTTGTVGVTANPDTDRPPSNELSPSVAFSNGTYVIVWIKNRQTVGRTMDTSGNFLTGITTLGFNIDSAPHVSASPSNGFLVTWQEASTTTVDYSIQHLIVNASLTVTVGTSALVDSGSSPVTNPISIFSVTDGQWLTLFSMPLSSSGTPAICGCYVGTSGVSSQVEVLTDGSQPNASSPRLTWNSNTDQFLTVFSTSGSGTNILVGEFEAVNGPPPSIPTGLAATGLNARVSLTWNSVRGASYYVVYSSLVSGGPYQIVGTPVSNSFVDAPLNDGVTYFYTVSCVGLSGESAISAEVSAVPKPPTSFGALLVVGSATLNAGDTAIKNALQNLGYSVTVKTDTSATSADATGKSIIVLSATANSANVGSTFTFSQVPIVNLNPGLMNPLGMTGPNSGTDFGATPGQSQILMVPANASHPMAAGQSGTVTVLSTTDTFTFGVPNANGVSIATLTADSSKSVVFGYEAQALMVGVSAQARRVGFFLNVTTASKLTPVGKTLLNAAISWAAGTPAAPDIVSTFSAGSYITLNWSPSTGALSYVLLRSNSPNGPFTVLASAITGTTYTDSTAAVGSTHYYKVEAVNDSGLGLASAVQQGVAQNGPQYFLTVSGPRDLQTVDNNNPGQPPFYFQGLYRPTVARVVTVNGVEQRTDITNWITAIGPLWNYVTNPHPSLAELSLGHQNPLQLTATTIPGETILSCSAHLVGPPPNSETHDVLGYFSVRTIFRYNLVPVRYRFPTPAQGATIQFQTQLDPQYPPPPGDTNNAQFFNASMFVQGNDVLNSEARIRFASLYDSQLDTAWTQAGIRYYLNVIVPDTITLPPAGDTYSDWFNAASNGFVVDHPVVAGSKTNYPNSHGFRVLAGMNVPGSINVYFFRALYSYDAASKNRTLNGITFGADIDQPEKNTILLADSANANVANHGVSPGANLGPVVAHEVGHSLGLGEVGPIPLGESDPPRLDPIEGFLNNFVELFGPFDTRSYSNNVMYRFSPVGGSLSGNQVGTARQGLVLRSQARPPTITFQREPVPPNPIPREPSE